MHVHVDGGHMGNRRGGGGGGDNKRVLRGTVKVGAGGWGGGELV